MTYAVIPIIVLAVCIYLGMRRSTLVVIFGYLAFEGFLKLLSNYNPVVHLGMDIVVLGLSLVLGAQAIALRRARLPALPWTGLLLLYALWVVLQIFSPYSPGLVPTLAAFKLHLTMIPLYYITAAVIRDREDVIALFGALTAVMLVPYAMALGQYALGPESVLDLSPRFWQNISYFHEWRPFGSSAVPGGTSVLAFLATPMALTLLAAAKPRSRRQILAVASVTLAGAVFYVSGVRQLFLGCVLALLVMGALVAMRRAGRTVAAAALVLVLGTSAYAGVETVLRPMATEALRTDPRALQTWRENPVTDRLLSLTLTETYVTARRGSLDAIQARLEHYPLGAGLGRVGPGAAVIASALRADPQTKRIEADIGYSENFFAVMLQEVGIPGTVMLAMLLVGMLVGAVRLARHARDPVIMTAAAGIAGIFFAVLVMSWGSQPFTSNPITAWYWLLAGILAAMRRMEAAKHEEPETASAGPGPRETRDLLP